MKGQFSSRLSLLAEADLERVAWYIFSTSRLVEAAERVVTGIRRKIDSLPTLPHQGTRRDDILPGLRLLPLGKAVIAFTVDDDTKTVFVLRLFYGGEDIMTALGKTDLT